MGNEAPVILVKTAHFFSVIGLIIVLAAIAIPVAIGGVASNRVGRIARTDLFLARVLAERPRAIIIGDSRVARSEAPPSGVLSVGYSSARTEELINVTHAICRLARPRRVVFQPGINDGREHLASVANFASSYEALINACPAPERVILGIWPGEIGRRPYGQAVSNERVAAFNRALQHLASRLNATYVSPPHDVIGMTVDGLHFTPAANHRWSQVLASAASR